MCDWVSEGQRLGEKLLCRVSGIRFFHTTHLLADAYIYCWYGDMNIINLIWF